MSSYEIGYISGFAVVIIISMLCALFFKRKSPKPVYDERQTLCRFKAYKNAVWVLMCYVAVTCVVFGPLDIAFADITTLGFIGICLAGVVLAVTCIFNDCYYGINQQPKRYMRLLIAIAVANIMIFINNMRDGGSIITDGMLNYKSIHPIGTVMILIVIIASAIKQHLVREEAES